MQTLAGPSEPEGNVPAQACLRVAGPVTNCPYDSVQNMTELACIELES